MSLLKKFMGGFTKKSISKTANIGDEAFERTDVNSLSPELTKLTNRLAEMKDAKELLEGRGITRKSSDASVRSFDKLKTNAMNQTAVSFETVRNQVLEYLPGIVAELGVAVDIELVADMIVPAKISTPLVDATIARTALRQIVHEELIKLNATAEILEEGTIKTKGIKQSVATALEDLMSEGVVSRVGLSAYTRNIRNAEQDASSPVMESGENEEMFEEMPMQATANANEIGELAPANVMPDSTFVPQDQLPLDNQILNQDEQSVIPNDVVGEVRQLPDNDMASALDPNATAENGQMPLFGLNEGITPNAEDAYFDGQPNDMQDLPEERPSVNRVEQAASVRIRPLEKKASSKQSVKPSNFNLFSVAGKVSSAAPVQTVFLNEKAKLVLSNTPALGAITAVYSDGSDKTWNIHVADVGTLFSSEGENNGFVAKTAKHFAEFLTTSPSFVKFAELPTQLMSFEDNQEPQVNVDSIALPDSGNFAPDSQLGGDPALTELEPTVLNPSPDNMLDNGGLMNDESLFTNQNANTEQANPLENTLVDVAVDMLPEAEQLDPMADEATHMNMALAWSATYLGNITKYAAAQELSSPHWSPENESYEGYRNRVNTQFPGALSKYRQHLTGLSSGEQPMDFEQFMSHNYGPKEQPVSGPQFSGNQGGAYDNGAVKSYVDKLNNVAPLNNDSLLPGMGNGDVPAAKIRLEKAKEFQNQNSGTVAPPKPVDRSSEWKTLSDKEPEGLEKIDWESPEIKAKYDTPGGVPKTKGRPKAVKPPSGGLDALDATASLSAQEFVDFGMLALVEAGYTDEEILYAYAHKVDASLLKEADGDSAVFTDYTVVDDVAEPVPETSEADKRGLHGEAANCSDPKFTKKEHRQEEHIQESEEKSGKSPEEAEKIGYATVNKEKHTASD